MKSKQDYPVIYISFVITSRNDGHGSEELQRMQLFVNSLHEQCIRFNVNAELILVEWNPPAERPPLAEALKWPQQAADRMETRIIRVPPEIHRGFKNSDSIPLFQMIAKNVGIRRAQGKFVLATNIDILFSNELIQFFAREELRPDRMYRIARYDVPSAIPTGLTVDARLNWCAQNLKRIHRHHDTVEVMDGEIPPSPIIKESSRRKLKRWLFRMDPPLFTNACGDFTLLSREKWQAVSGYAEFPLRAMKIDGLLCYAAHYAGARETILEDPMRIYHLEHPARADGALIALSERRRLTENLQITSAQFASWVEEMRRSHQPLIFNEAQWGLADIKLPETIVSKAGN